MELEEKLNQTRVGIFMLIGLCVIGIMVVYFGRAGDGFKKYYDITVNFENASGVIRGANVLLAGAKVGDVAEPPRILPNMQGVAVKLRIFDQVKIPDQSVFTIGSSGLLGDRFIQIGVGEKAASSPPLQPGVTVNGIREMGMDDLAFEGKALVTDLRAAIKKIDTAVDRVNSDLLKPETFANLNTAMENIRKTSTSFADASVHLDKIMSDASSAIETGKQTLVSAKGAADELQKTIVDVHGIVRDVKNGKGILGALVSDQEMAQNIRALVSNLRRNGIIFYKDTGKPAERTGR